MPTDELPEALRPYKFHGLDLTKANSKDYVADCPFCGGENKLSIKADNGICRCFTCAEGSESGGMNPTTFLRTLLEVSLEATDGSDYSKLSKERKLLYPETPKLWKLAKSITTGRWIIPGYNVNQKMVTLYQLTRLKDKEGKYKERWLPTPTLGQHLHLSEHNFDASKPVIYLCEGPGDAMALWEVVQNCTDLLEEIGNATVLAIPGCNNFNPSWCKLFSDKHVCIMFDSDMPKRNKKTGAMLEPASIIGTKRTFSLLQNYQKPPASVQWLDWGGNGLGYDEELPSGYDLRDYLSQT